MKKSLFYAMKRVIVFFFFFPFLFAFVRLSAQTLDSLAHHNLGSHSAQTTSFMEMSDGSLLGGIDMADEYPFFVPIGYLLQKVSRTDSGLKVTDSVFFPEEVFWHLKAKDPQGEGYIHIEVANDSENESSFLLIRRFDDNLNYDTTETVVGLEQFMVKCGDPGIILTPDGDIVVSYYRHGSSSNVEYNFARIGLDGTIKQKVANDSINIRAGYIRGPVLFSENPLRYCWWGGYYDQVEYEDNVNMYVLDSLFNITSSYTMPWGNSAPGYFVEYLLDGALTKCLGLKEGCFLVAMSYNRSYLAIPYIEDDGVMVMKYDADFNLLGHRKFISEPYYQYHHHCAKPIGFGHSDDGNVFFAYFTNSLNWPSQVSVVKMDRDLNIIWQRHCLEREPGREFGRMIVLDDNSVAVTGINKIYTSNGLIDHTEAFYLVVHDNYDALEEQGIIVRPYAYWPNPAQDELHLQYSPDVTPTQIELHDLHGRMVRSQRNGLESLNLQGLSSGTYTMRVTLAGGKVFTDKVVKE